MYSFTRYFEWPDNKKVGSFVIYVVGKNDNMVSELKLLASKKKVGNQDIEINNTPTFDPSINANMVYLTPEISKSVSDVISRNKNKGTLVISEGVGGCRQGASINFIILESKLKFEYNKNNAVKSGLKTNDDFKNLAAVNID
jgi:hypothetical protein